MSNQSWPASAVLEQEGVWTSSAESSSREQTLTYRVPSAERDWEAEAAQRILDIVRLKDDWDRAGSQKVQAEQASVARDIVHRLAAMNMPRPFVTSTQEGGVVLEWDSERVICELAVQPGNILRLYYRLIANDESWEGELVDSPRDLGWLLGYLAPRLSASEWTAEF